MLIDIDFELDGDGVRSGGPNVVGLANRTGDVVVDLSRVTRLDSSGIGLLVHLQKRTVERRGRFAIANANGQPKKLLADLNLLQIWSSEAPAKRPVMHRKAVPAIQNG